MRTSPLRALLLALAAASLPAAPALAADAFADTLAASTSCAATATSLCLGGDRFAVGATFETPQGQTGTAQVHALTDETGYLWFFSDNNVEAVVKVLDGCGVNGHFWVFMGGLTNVRVVVTVTDTASGETKQYVNPLGQPFQPIQDTTAFPTCS